MKIIVDAMGGDFAPEVVIQGAIAAAIEYRVDIVLVGDASTIDALLAKPTLRQRATGRKGRSHGI